MRGDFASLKVRRDLDQKDTVGVVFVVLLKSTRLLNPIKPTSHAFPQYHMGWCYFHLTVAGNGSLEMLDICVLERRSTGCTGELYDAAR